MKPRTIELIRLFKPGALAGQAQYEPDYIERLLDFNEGDESHADHALVCSLVRPEPGLRVLDFGCGVGALSDLMSYSGAIVTGCDVNEMLLHYARLEHPETLFIHGLTPVGITYDVIVSTHVLGHLDNPLETLIELRKRVKRGGRLVLLIPNRNQALIRWLPNVFKRYEPDATILRHWSKRSLKRLLKKAGFDVIVTGVYGEKYLRTRARVFAIAGGV